MFLSKAGYERVSSFGHSIQSAVKNKRLEAVMFLGMLYTTEDEVRKYQENKKEIDKNLLQEGFCLLSEVASPKLYIKVRKEHPEFLRKSKSKLYINREGLNFLDKEREKNSSAVADTNTNSSSDTVKLIDVAMTWKEYSRLKKAVRRGEIPGYYENRIWLTSYEAIDEFRREQDRMNAQEPDEITIFSAISS